MRDLEYHFKNCNTMMQYPETKINAEDKFNNKLDLENFKSYSIGDKKIFCYLKTGQTLELNYDSNEKASEIYEKILSIEDEAERCNRECCDDDYFV